VSLHLLRALLFRARLARRPHPVRFEIDGKSRFYGDSGEHFRLANPSTEQILEIGEVRDAKPATTSRRQQDVDADCS